MKFAPLSLILWLAVPAGTLADPFDTALQAAAEGRDGEAAAAFHGLAMAGDAEAAYNLALLFATGRGIPQNDTEALYWAWRARLADVHAASDLLDRLWPHPDEARRKIVSDRLEGVLRPVAEAGDGAAMLQLAAVLSVVRSEADLTEAYGWQSLAAALDVSGAVGARDATLAMVPVDERPKVQDAALAMFMDWCKRRTTGQPAACAVVLATGPEPGDNG
jgi:hypothetical protein